MLINDIKSLPNLPGVYEYFDENAKLLYVGKAKNLKKRVRSYFSFTPNLAPNPRVSLRIQKMINESIHLKYIVTKSEADALILENSFIKQLNPKYNILLRDDKTYPYIYIDLNENFPRFNITRKVIKGSNIKYFGPYFKGSREILETLYMKFKLVQKNGCLKNKKACLFYQINRCLAPCEEKITKKEYDSIIKDALYALKNPTSMVEYLKELMLKYSLNENYEEAANLRDKIEMLKESDQKIEVDLARLEDFEVFAINSFQSFACAVRLSIRDGKITNSNSKIINLKNFENLEKSEIDEIYKQTLLDAFPTGSPVAVSKIYVNDDFLDIDLVGEILEARHSKKFEIIVPKIGEKRKICNIAHQNAKINIQKHLKAYDFEFLNTIKKYFGFTNLPINIEAYDNSHMFGSAVVGAMIAYNEDGFNKQNYRHAHLKSNNDYDQMKEYLTMRVNRFDKLNPPDLWVIDGGVALLNLADEILKSVGANVDIIAISKEKVDAKAYRSKGAAKDKLYTKNGEFLLPPSDKKLQFFQKLRDEAHRFAISFHQKTKRKNDLQKSNLIKSGLSEGKIKKLLDYFGSFEKIYDSNFDEISNLIGKTAAKKIFL
ncbi:MAG: excinuclease ABC subunit UvrC [Campylobacter ureolyticus]|uniref:excinuclease ABC subunit UvrC n=1 Tax=Campylobacter ureolyticus TaxID=827 RepID=UPI0022B56CEB|nr:excinuclease ABC subunit UvrC [Campylobacter ureolyticus]MCZ6103270.1 excinuclease ABC subunit UvrC [Campylobacter ureolyticus]MDU4981684.1 excinuclease ABC subunit UvrC [Campylobacter ureolyticus]